MTAADIMAYQTTHDDYVAQVEGGRLIEWLPASIASLSVGLTEHNDTIVQWVNDYRLACEVDIINLLIGPLAEAKHVAHTDDETFNHQLVNLEALKNYGGSSDIALANDYLQSFSADKQQKDKKLAELFIVAFNFVNNDANWAAITQLADYILGSSENIIGCEEIVSTLDHSVAHFHDRRSKARHRHG